MCPETFSHLKFSFPLEHLTKVMARAALDIAEAYSIFIEMAKLFYSPGSDRLLKIKKNEKFLYYTGRLRQSTKMSSRRVRQDFSIVPASAAQNEILTRLRPLIERNVSWTGFKAELYGVVDQMEYDLKNARASRHSRASLRTFQDLFKILSDCQKEILLATDSLWLWTGIRIVSSEVHEGCEETSVPALKTAAGSATD